MIGLSMAAVLDRIAHRALMLNMNGKELQKKVM